MEHPQMQLIGTIQPNTGLVLTPLLQADPSVCSGMAELNRLNIASNGNNGHPVDLHNSDSSVVDALSFFGRKDKTPSPANAQGGNQDDEMKGDDGDAKELWAGNKAVMPVHRDSEVYNMNHAKRGRALILNHENFLPQMDLGRRYGTERDKANLVSTLTTLGFEVSAYDDLTYHQVADKIQELTKEDHSKHDCLIVAVLSHGDTQLLYAKDYSYKPDMLWQSFTADKCPSLAGKPKLFMVQACQGSQLDEGTKLVRVSRTETDSSPQSYRIPNHADFLIAFSTVPGFYSWRNTTNGSWFVQAICTVFNKYASKKDVLSMMTIIAREVALSFESNTPSQPHMNQKKQMPFITSTLIRDVYLVPKPKTV